MSDEKRLSHQPPLCLSVVLWLLLQFIVYMDFFLVCTSCWGIQLHKPLSLMIALWSYPGLSFTKLLDLIM